MSKYLFAAFLFLLLSCASDGGEDTAHDHSDADQAELDTATFDVSDDELVRFIAVLKELSIYQDQVDNEVREVVTGLDVDVDRLYRFSQLKHDEVEGDIEDEFNANEIAFYDSVDTVFDSYQTDYDTYQKQVIKEKGFELDRFHAISDAIEMHPELVERIMELDPEFFDFEA